MTHHENGSNNAQITQEQYQELRQARISQELERRALGTGNRIRVVVGALDAIEEDLSQLKVGASPIMEDFERVSVLLKDLHALSGTKKKLSPDILARVEAEGLPNSKNLGPRQIESVIEKIRNNVVHPNDCRAIDLSASTVGLVRYLSSQMELLAADGILNLTDVEALLPELKAILKPLSEDVLLRAKAVPRFLTALEEALAPGGVLLRVRDLLTGGGSSSSLQEISRQNMIDLESVESSRAQLRRLSDSPVESGILSRILGIVGSATAYGTTYNGAVLEDANHFSEAALYRLRGVARLSRVESTTLENLVPQALSMTLFSEGEQKLAEGQILDAVSGYREVKERRENHRKVALEQAREKEKMLPPPVAKVKQEKPKAQPPVPKEEGEKPVIRTSSTTSPEEVAEILHVFVGIKADDAAALSLVVTFDEVTRLLSYLETFFDRDDALQILAIRPEMLTDVDGLLKRHSSLTAAIENGVKASASGHDLGHQFMKKLVREFPEVLLQDPDEFEVYTKLLTSALAEYLRQVDSEELVDSGILSPIAHPDRYATSSMLGKVLTFLGVDVSREAEELSAEEIKLRRVKEALASDGVDPEIAYAIIRWGVISHGELRFGAHYVPVEFGKEIVRQKFRSKLNPKDFVAAVDYLVDSGALLIHKKGETWSLNPHGNEISREGARMAVSHVREIFLNR